MPALSQQPASVCGAWARAELEASGASVPGGNTGIVLLAVVLVVTSLGLASCEVGISKQTLRADTGRRNGM